MKLPTWQMRSSHSWNSIRATSLLPRKVSRRIGLPAAINISHVHKLFKETFIALEAWKTSPVVILSRSQKDNFNGRLSVTHRLPLDIGLLESIRSRVADGFYALRLIQVHEQCQDCLNKIKNELKPLEFVHDITPSRLRGSRYLQPAAINISHVHKAFKKIILRRRGVFLRKNSWRWRAF